MDDLFLDEPAISRSVRRHDDPGIEVRVNFGVFAGRHATPAEIDEFAVALRELAPSFSIVSEERHEFGGAVEASVHQVVVELSQEVVGEEPELLAEKIVFAANGWALECIASRHGAGEL
jgi:flagellar biosynthesis/type III secretory pathway protein FliH